MRCGWRRAVRPSRGLPGPPGARRGLLAAGWPRWPACGYVMVSHEVRVQVRVPTEAAAAPARDWRPAAAAAARRHSPPLCEAPKLQVESFCFARFFYAPFIPPRDAKLAAAAGAGAAVAHAARCSGRKRRRDWIQALRAGTGGSRRGAGQGRARRGMAGRGADGAGQKGLTQTCDDARGFHTGGELAQGNMLEAYKTVPAA